MSTVNNNGSVGVQNYGMPGMSPNEAEAKTLERSPSDAELGLANLPIPQSTPHKPLLQPTGFALVEAAFRGLDVVTRAPKDPDKYLRPNIGN